MSKVYIVPEDVGVDELPDVLLLIVATDALVLELASDLCHLLINYLLLLVLCLTVSDVSDVKRETAHRVLLVICHFGITILIIIFELMTGKVYS